MYIAVLETGTVSFRFLADRARAMGLDSTGELAAFRRDVHALRTFLQHNLDPANREDAEKRAIAQRWMLCACNREEIPSVEFWPQTSDEWHAIAEEWCSYSCHFLEKNALVLQAITTDASRDIIVTEWARRCSLGLQPHEFVPIIEAAALALDLPPVDPQRVMQKHYNRWNNLLRLLDESADAEAEARRIVDQTLAEDWQTYCPIDGDDIIATFSVPVGPRIGELLLRARQIWLQQHCSRDELLRNLTEYLRVDGPR
jgi:hypothetical protein